MTDLNLPYPAQFGNRDMLLLVVFIGLMESVHYTQGRISIREWLAKQPATFRWTVYYGVVIALVVFTKHTDQQFIYFQF